MTTPAEAAQVLAKCACYDPVFSRPDKALAVGWAEAFSRYDLALPDLLEAVTAHYVESADRAMPVHIIKHAREIRRVRAERESADERREREDKLDRKHALQQALATLADRKAI